MFCVDSVVGAGFKDKYAWTEFKFLNRIKIRLLASI